MSSNGKAPQGPSSPIRPAPKPMTAADMLRGLADQFEASGIDAQRMVVIYANSSPGVTEVSSAQVGCNSVESVIGLATMAINNLMRQ